MDNTKNRIPFKDKAIWASCDGLGTLMAWNIFASYLTFYFTDILGIAVGLAGNIILISRSVDIVTDFLIGVAIDRFNFKSGKYRGWLKLGILPMTLQLPLIFLPLENVSMTFRIVWIIVVYGTYGFIWNTIVCAPTHAQLVNMTSDIEERSSAIGIREVFYNIGMFLVSAAFLPLVNLFGKGNQGRGFFFAVCVFSLIAFISMGANFMIQKKYELNEDGSYKAHLAKSEKAEKKEKGNLLKELVLVAKNRPAVIILISVLLANTLMVVKSSLMIYSFKYYFDLEGFYPVVMGVFTIGTILGAVLIKYFVKWFKDSSRGFIVVLILSIVFNCAFFFGCRAMGPEAAAGSLQFGLLFFILIISSLFQGAHYGFGNLLVPSTIDYGHWLTGKLQIGLIYGLYALDISAGGAIGGKLTTVLLNMANYVPNAVQTESARNGILFATFMVPVLFTVGQLILQFFYGLSDEKHKKCVEEIAARSENGEATPAPSPDMI